MFFFCTCTFLTNAIALQLIDFCPVSPSDTNGGILRCFRPTADQRDTCPAVKIVDHNIILLLLAFLPLCFYHSIVPL
uniref:Putative secreted peptide n=1 Tax=Anopheles braziliensis TaxID=58242 RepID=A0A2M3ZQR9_9DIPT